MTAFLWQVQGTGTVIGLIVSLYVVYVYVDGGDLQLTGYSLLRPYTMDLRQYLHQKSCHAPISNRQHHPLILVCEYWILND